MSFRGAQANDFVVLRQRFGFDPFAGTQASHDVATEDGEIAGLLRFQGQGVDAGSAGDFDSTATATLAEVVGTDVMGPETGCSAEGTAVEMELSLIGCRQASPSEVIQPPAPRFSKILHLLQ